MLTEIDIHARTDGVTNCSRMLEREPERILLDERSFQLVDGENVDFNLVTGVYRILTHPQIVHRFNNPPKTPDALAELLSDERHHLFAVTHPKTGEVVGTFSLDDGKAPEHEHWLGKVGVSPALQGKGLGKQILEYALYRTFMDRAYDGRWREKLYIGITKNPGFEAIEHLVEDAGCKRSWMLQHQIGEQGSFNTPAALVYNWKSEMCKRFNTLRYEISMKDWWTNALENNYETVTRLHLTNTMWDMSSPYLRSMNMAQ